MFILPEAARGMPTLCNHAVPTPSTKCNIPSVLSCIHANNRCLTMQRSNGVNGLLVSETPLDLHFQIKQKLTASQVPKRSIILSLSFMIVKHPNILSLDWRELMIEIPGWTN